MALIENPVMVVTTHAKVMIMTPCAVQKVQFRHVTHVLTFSLTVITDAGLADDPRQAKEEHDTPNVEQASHQNALDPTKLDDVITCCVCFVLFHLWLPGMKPTGN